MARRKIQRITVDAVSTAVHAAVYRRAYEAVHAVLLDTISAVQQGAEEALEAEGCDGFTSLACSTGSAIGAAVNAAFADIRSGAVPDEAVSPAVHSAIQAHVRDAVRGVLSGATAIGQVIAEAGQAGKPKT